MRAIVLVFIAEQLYVGNTEMRRSSLKTSILYHEQSLIKSQCRTDKRRSQSAISIPCTPSPSCVPPLACATPAIRPRPPGNCRGDRSLRNRNQYFSRGRDAPLIKKARPSLPAWRKPRAATPRLIGSRQLAAILSCGAGFGAKPLARQTRNSRGAGGFSKLPGAFAASPFLNFREPL